MASRGERHTAGHTKRSGGVKTSKLGAVQRRVLVNVFHAAWDKASAVDPPLDLSDVWVDWDPKQHMDATSKPSSSTISTALTALEVGRLLLVRRHKVRAHAVRLTAPGREQAIELVQGQGRTSEENRKRRADGLPAEMRTAAFVVERELKRRDLPAAQRALFDEYRRRYRDYTRGLRGPDSIVELFAAFRALGPTSLQNPGRNPAE